jgi:AraC-like DNA-binding protein
MRGLSGYQSAIAHHYASMSIQSSYPDEAYAWSVSGRQVGAIGLTHIFAGGPVCARITREADAVSPRNYILAFVEDGAFEIEQGRRQTLCGAQSVVLMNTTKPLEARHAGTATIFSLILPASFLRLRIPQVDELCTSARPAAAGTAALLRDLIKTSWREREDIACDEAPALAAAFTGMIDCVFRRGNESLPESAHLAALRERILAIVDAELTNPRLGPMLVAERLCISTSYLFMIARKLGISIRQWIINRRLDACRDALGDPVWCGRTITEIALDWGFQDSAHFSRRFSRRFGITPREYRERTGSSMAS